MKRIFLVVLLMFFLAGLTSFAQQSDEKLPAGRTGNAEELRKQGLKEFGGKFYTDKELKKVRDAYNNHIKKGNKLWKAKKYKQAVAEYEKAHKINPLIESLTTNLGIIYWNLKSGVFKVD